MLRMVRWKMIRIEEILFNNEVINMSYNKRVSSNGRMIADEAAKTVTIHFATHDPNITQQ